MSLFNIDTKIDINFSEEQIKEALTAVIQKERPEITVEDITFVIKRNPTNISASVDASMKGFTAAPKVEEVEEVIKEEEQIELTLEEETASEKVTDFLDLG